jgi:signal transduction histidine kinase
MSWIDVAWPMMAAMCLTLALITLLAWLRQRSRLDYLAFCVLGVCVALFAAGEWNLMRAENPQRYGDVLRWMHVVIFIGEICIALFVQSHLKSGRPWLFWSFCAARSVALALNFSSGANINYLEVTELRYVQVLGDTIAVGVGETNPLQTFEDFTNLLLLLFLIDTSVSGWRRGDRALRRRVIVIGGSLSVFFLLAAGHASLLHRGLVQSPHVVTLSFLLVVVIMAYELGSDLLRAARMEEEMTQRRSELAHLSRMAVMGELSGALAHELNQPLAAILGNAQAAQRYLARGDVNLNEIRDMLADIVDSDRRAGEVIKRLRALFRKEEARHDALDLNEVVAEVLLLTRSDLISRRVVVDLDLAPQLPAVSGDRVQLQQVLLNFVVNGCDAMSGEAASCRLAVRTGLADARTVVVTVSDTGQGIPAADLERIFEPFVSTKADGMGLGLAVCRTIISAHGGRVWATNNSNVGASLHFALPAARRSAQSERAG